MRTCSDRKVSLCAADIIPECSILHLLPFVETLCTCPDRSVVFCAAGIIPECSIVCYFGSLSENISQIASGQAGPSGKVTYILVGVTIFFMIAAVTWSTLVVRYLLTSQAKRDFTLFVHFVMLFISHYPL